MVKKPLEYRWSSFVKKAEGVSDPVVDYDPIYKALGNTAADRRKAYQEYVFETIPEEELKLICDSIQRNQVTGGNHFRKQLEKK